SAARSCGSPAISSSSWPRASRSFSGYSPRSRRSAFANHAKGEPILKFFFLAAALLVASACNSAPADTSESATLIADLSDYKIVVDHPSIAAGHVVFGIRNHATMAHEFKVIKTDLAPDQLPVDAASAK